MPARHGQARTARRHPRALLPRWGREAPRGLSVTPPQVSCQFEASSQIEASYQLDPTCPRAGSRIQHAPTLPKCHWVPRRSCGPRRRCCCDRLLPAGTQRRQHSAQPPEGTGAAQRAHYFDCDSSQFFFTYHVLDCFGVLAFTLHVPRPLDEPGRPGNSRELWRIDVKVKRARGHPVAGPEQAEAHRLTASSTASSGRFGTFATTSCRSWTIGSAQEM